MPAQAAGSSSDHFLNENEFWLKYPVATYAKSESDFYEGSRSGECNWRGHGMDSNKLHDFSWSPAIRVQR